MLVMFFLLPNLRAPSADRPETLPHDRNLWQFYKLTPKIMGALPPKNLGPHIENRKSSLSTTAPPMLGQKSWCTLVHKRKSY